MISVMAMTSVTTLGVKWSRHSGHPGRGLLSRVESKIDKAQEEKKEAVEEPKYGPIHSRGGCAL